MKKKSFIVISLLFLICISINSQDSKVVNGQTASTGNITAKQTDLIFEKSRVFPANTQLSIAIIENGTPFFYGIKIINDSLLSVDNHRQIFEIGSITKVFTSTLLAELVIENKIKLGEDINNYLSLPLKNNTKITFRQLANHTSGLPRLPSNFIIADVSNPYKDYDEEKLKEYLTEKLTLVQNQPEKYEYSNLGAGLLGYVLSKIETTNYESLLKNKIFTKYQMSNSTTNRENVEDLLIKGLNAAGYETSNWDLSVLIGAGGILSCTDDLAKFAIAQFDDSNKALALTRTKTFDVNKNMGIGLGWHIIKTQSGDEWTWHNGGTGGYSTSMAIDLKKKSGVIILSNVSAFHKNMGNIDNLCFELMNTLGNNSCSFVN